MTISDIQIRNNDGAFEPLKLPITNGGTGATNASDAITNLGVYALKNGIEIPANANITNYTTIGNYYCPATATVKTLQNCPTTVAFTMRVYYATGSGYVAQEIEEYNSGIRWRRVYDDWGKAWGSWVCLDRYNYLPLSGGTVTGNLTVNGLFNTPQLTLEDNSVMSKVNGVHFSPEKSDKYVYVHAAELAVWNFDTTAAAPVYASKYLTPSSEKLKENIQDLDDTYAEKILDIRPVTFKYINDNNHSEQTGVIAEEIKDIVPEAFYQSYDEELGKDIIAVDYLKFIPRLIKLVQVEKKSQEDIDEITVALYERQSAQQIETDLALTSIYEAMIGGE